MGEIPTLKILKDESGYTFVTPRLDSGIFLKMHDVVLETGETYTSEDFPNLELFQKVKVKTLAKSKVDGIPDIHYLRYKETLKKLKEKFRQVGNDDWVWDSLEDEFAYRKFLEQYEVISREDVISIGHIPYSIEEKIPSDNPFLVPLRHLGKNILIQKAVYTRRAFWISEIHALLKENGFLPNKNSSAKGTYSFYDYKKGEVSLFIEGTSVIQQIGLHDVTDEYSIVKNKLEQDRQEIHKKISIYLNSRVKVANMAAVLDIMREIEHKTSALPIKVTGQSDFRSLMLFIRTKISEMETSLLEEKGKSQCI
jgi:hypothetical protein